MNPANQLVHLVHLRAQLADRSALGKPNAVQPGVARRRTGRQHEIGGKVEAKAPVPQATQLEDRVVELSQQDAAEAGIGVLYCETRVVVDDFVGVPGERVGPPGGLKPLAGPVFIGR